MAKAKVLLKRRKSVRNTKKITKTMEMVSTAKYKQAFGRVQAAAPYQEKLREVMTDLAGAGAEISHPLLETRPVKRTLVFLVTSTRGMCGGYNSNLNATARGVLASERAAGAEPELHVVGKKGIQYFRLRKEPIAVAHDRLGDRVTFADVDGIADGMIRRYSAREIDKVVVVFQRFYSAGRQRPVAETLLPLEAVPGAEAGEGTPPEPGVRPDANYIFSPDPTSLLRELLPAYVKTTLWTDFLQASVGEQLARMVAMKNATDAADKLIRALTRMYNRARQTQITNEIAELMGGVEALK